MVVLVDQFTKYLVLTHLGAGESISVIPGVFHLTLVENRGIAFGFFHRHESLLFLLVTGSLIFLIIFGYRLCLRAVADSANREPGTLHPSPFAFWGIVLILGGAIGNWIDRVRFNAVIDFLDFRIWPVFNFADTAITIGVGLYLLLVLRKK